MDYKTENYKILKPLLDELFNNRYVGHTEYRSAKDFISFELEKEPLNINFLLRNIDYEEPVKEYFMLNLMDGAVNVHERTLRNKNKDVLDGNKGPELNNKKLNFYLKQI